MSTLTLVVGNKNYSSWSLRPWILMRHHGLDFNERRISLFVDSTAGELAPYGSDGKVPVLQDGEVLVWDSLAILEYVSETALEGRGWPNRPEARALARSISAEMHSSFVHLRDELPMNCRKVFQNVRLSAGARRDIERVRGLWRLCRSRFGTSGPWLFGEYSIADAMFAPVVIRFDGYGIALEGAEAAYANAVLEHPAIREWIKQGRQESEVIDIDEIGPDRYEIWRER